MEMQDAVQNLGLRAANELNAAAAALQQAHLLFTLIGNAVASSGDLSQAKTLAVIGAELVCNYGNRAEDEAAQFEVRHV
jgi:hypothetical protein